jgi:hypothetical protein
MWRARRGREIGRRVMAPLVIAALVAMLSVGDAHGPPSAYAYDGPIASTTGWLSSPQASAGDFHQITGMSGGNALSTDPGSAAEEGLPAIAGGSQLEDLAATGRQLDPADAGGELTRAGRAYSKAPEVFGPTSGGPAAINEAGQNALEGILGNSATKQGVMRGGNFAGGEIHIAPNGIGAVFDPGGVFQYFGRFPY